MPPIPIEQTDAQRKATFAAAGMQPAPTLAPAPQPLSPQPVTTSALAAPDPRVLAAQVNAESSQIYEATKSQNVDLRQSETIIRDIATKLATPAPVAPPSLSQMFTQERQKLGLDPLEAQLAQLDSEIERTQVGAYVGADRVNDRPIGNTGRALRQDQISKEGQRQVALLNVERSAVARQIDNKMTALQMAMEFTQQDYANASASYNTEFSRNMQMLDLFTGLQDREDAKQDKLKTNAIANLETITNLVKDSGESFADMSEDQLRNLRQWEVQAGMPAGTFEAFGTVKPEAKVLHTSTGKDAAGNDIVTFIYDDGSGHPGVVQSIKTGTGTPVITDNNRVIDPTTGAPAEYGSPEYVVGVLQGSAKYGKNYPVASEREQLTKYGNVIGQAEALISTLGDKETGPLTGYLKSLNPYSFDARAVNAQLQAIVPNVARGIYGEVGVLTNQDIQNYMQTLPNLKSTSDQNKFVAAMTLKNAQRSMENSLVYLANSGINVSGFTDTYQNLRSRVNGMEAELGVGQSADLSKYVTEPTVTPAPSQSASKAPFTWNPSTPSEYGGGFFSQAWDGFKSFFQ